MSSFSQLLNSFTKETVPRAIELLKDEQTRRDYLERFPDIPHLMELWSIDSSLNDLMVDIIQNHDISLPFLSSFSVFYKKKDGKVLEALVKIAPKQCYQLFDFSAKVDVFAWLGVWGNFIEYGDAEVKKAVLEAKCFAIPPIISKMKEKMIQYVLKIWKIVLDDETLSRTIKVSYFNNFVLEKLLKLYEKESLAEQLHEFMTELCTIPGQGICFLDFGWYPPKGNNLKIYNKILQLFIPQLSISCPYQNALLFDILKACPELIPSYYDYLSAHLSFDPRSSAKWAENLDLVTQIMDLPIPPSFSRVDMELNHAPPTKTMADNILPSMFNKVTTSKALQCSDQIIKTLTCHVLEKSFDKLIAVMEIIKKKNWNQDDLLDMVRKSVPDIQIIISLLSSSELRQKGMALLSMYQKFFPDWVRSSRFDVAKCLDYVGDENMIDPVLTFLLHFPTFKWYSKSGSVSHLYTILALMDKSPKARLVIENLFQSSFLFAFKDEIPIFMDVLYAMKSSETYDKVLLFIDIHLSQCAKNPFSITQIMETASVQHVSYRKILLSSAVDTPDIPFNIFHAVFVQNVDQHTISFVTRLLQSTFYQTQSCDAMKQLIPTSDVPTIIQRYFDAFLLTCSNADDINISEEDVNDIVFHRSNQFQNLETELPLDIQIVNTILKIRKSPEEAEDLLKILQELWGRTTLIDQQLMLLRCLLREIAYLHESNASYSMLVKVLSSFLNSGLLSSFYFDVFLEHPFIRSEFEHLNLQIITLVVQVLNKYSIKKPFYFDIIKQKIIDEIQQNALFTVLETIVENNALSILSKNSFFEILNLNLNSERVKNELICHALRIESEIPLDIASQLVPLILGNEVLEKALKLGHLSPFYSAFTDSNVQWLLQNVNPRCARLACKLINAERIEFFVKTLKSDKIDNQSYNIIISEIIRLDYYLAQSLLSIKHCKIISDLICSVYFSETIDENQLFAISDHLSHLLRIPDFVKIFETVLVTRLPLIKKISHPKSALHITNQILNSNLNVIVKTQLSIMNIKDYVNAVRKTIEDVSLITYEDQVNQIVVSLESLLSSQPIVNHKVSDLFKPCFIALLKHRLIDIKFNALISLFAEVCISEKLILANEVLEMIFTHSQFEFIMFADKSMEVKAIRPSRSLLINLLTTVARSSDSLEIKSNILDIFSKAYYGTLVTSDIFILEYCKQYEKLTNTSVARQMIDSFPKLAPTQFPYESINQSMMYNSIIWFERTELFTMTQSSTADHFYDAKFILNILLQTILNKGYSEKLDLHTIFEKGFVGMAIMSLSSDSTDLRKLAYFALDTIYTTVRYLEHEILREKNQILLLLNSLKNTITDRESPQRIPTVITLFFSKSLAIILNPEEFMYPIVNKCFLQRPIFDIEDIPIFYDSFYSSSDNSKQERKWLLEILCHGVKDASDYKAYKRRFVLESFTTYFTSPLSDYQSKKLILNFIQGVAYIPSVISDMITNTGLIQLFSFHLEKLDFQENLEETLYAVNVFLDVLTGWLLVKDTWFGKGGRKVWVSCFNNVFNQLVKKLVNAENVNQSLMALILRLGLKIQEVGQTRLEEDIILAMIKSCNEMLEKNLFKFICKNVFATTSSDIHDWAFSVAYKLFTDKNDIMELSNWLTFIEFNQFVKDEKKELITFAWKVSKNLENLIDQKASLKRKNIEKHLAVSKKQYIDKKKT